MVSNRHYLPMAKCMVACVQMRTPENAQTIKPGTDNESCLWSWWWSIWWWWSLANDDHCDQYDVGLNDGGDDPEAVFNCNWLRPPLWSTAHQEAKYFRIIIKIIGWGWFSFLVIGILLETKSPNVVCNLNLKGCVLLWPIRLISRTVRSNILSFCLVFCTGGEAWSFVCLLASLPLPNIKPWRNVLHS